MKDPMPGGSCYWTCRSQGLRVKLQSSVVWWKAKLGSKSSKHQVQVQAHFLINNERPSQPRDTGMAVESSTTWFLTHTIVSEDRLVILLQYHSIRGSSNNLWGPEKGVAYFLWSGMSDNFFWLVFLIWFNTYILSSLFQFFLLNLWDHIFSAPMNKSLMSLY